MEESQLEDYRRRMREKYTNRQQDQPQESILAPKQSEGDAIAPQEPESDTAASESVHKQPEIIEPELEEVRAPIDIQKVERLVDPGYYYEPEAIPLIPEGEKRAKVTCWDKMKRDCGYKTWGSAWVVAGVLVAVAAVLILVLVFYH